MEDKKECSKCGQEMQWEERWGWWYCKACGLWLIHRYIRLDRAEVEIQQGDSPWELIKNIKLDP